jgi:hypothetical protein
MNSEKYVNYSGRHAPIVGTMDTPIRCSAPIKEESGELKDLMERMQEWIGIEIGADEPRPPNPMYEAWRWVIGQYGPYSHLFTLSFLHPYTDKEAISALKGWCSMTNRAVRGPRWKRHSKGMSGVAFAERHALSQAFRARLHFHVLISSSTTKGMDRLQDIAYENALALRDLKGRRMTNLDRIDLRDVGNEERLVGYLLKDLHSPHWKAGDSVAFWSPAVGLEGFEMPELGARALRKMH